MKFFYTLILILLVSMARAQCPDCTPDETCVSADLFPTICPLILPDATAGSYYETVLTFYLPAVIVDPDSQFEVSLDQVTITGVNGLPFGTDYEANNADNIYYPSAGESYGCAKVCGTPLVPGIYLVNISITVLVSVLGFEDEVQEGFSLQLTVLPGQGGNTSFAYNDLFGCGSLDVEFEALIDGSPGVTSYAWDFGNGNIGNVSNPPVQSYDEEGQYLVTLETTIESYLLNTVVLSQLSSGWGGDVEELSEALFSPDPYFAIRDADNSLVYQSNAYVDVNTGIWTNIGLVLDNPPYSINWYDQDSGGIFGSDDDDLGSASFNWTEGEQSFSGSDNTGTLNISLEATNVFSDEELVTVFPIPNADFTVMEDPDVLDYENDQLLTFVWTLFGDTVQSGIQDSLVLSAPGVYQCEVTNIYGCSAWSPEFVQCPEISILYNEGNSTLTVAGGFETYTWFFNGLQLDGESENFLENAIPGNYGVTITTDYGCEVSAEVFTVTTGVDDHSRSEIRVWPNPASNVLNLELPDGSWDLNILDAMGRSVRSSQEMSTGQVTVPIDDIAEGQYLIYLSQGTSVSTVRVLIQR